MFQLDSFVLSSIISLHLACVLRIVTVSILLLLLLMVKVPAARADQRASHSQRRDGRFSQALRPRRRFRRRTTSTNSLWRVLISINHLAVPGACCPFVRLGCVVCFGFSDTQRDLLRGEETNKGYLRQIRSRPVGGAVQDWNPDWRTDWWWVDLNVWNEDCTSFSR